MIKPIPLITTKYGTHPLYTENTNCFGAIEVKKFNESGSCREVGEYKVDTVIETHHADLVYFLLEYKDYKIVATTPTTYYSNGGKSWMPEKAYTHITYTLLLNK